MLTKHIAGRRDGDGGEAMVDWWAEREVAQWSRHVIPELEHAVKAPIVTAFRVFGARAPDCAAASRPSRRSAVQGMITRAVRA